MQVAYHKQLGSAEAKGIVSFRASHSKIDGIQDICTQHTYFIDNQQFGGPEHLPAHTVQGVYPGKRMLCVKARGFGELTGGFPLR